MGAIDMWCESCGAEVETRWVSFHYNIGVIVVRFNGATEGSLCKSCIHVCFWKYTAINLFLGWWGLISFFFNVGYLIANAVQYVGCLRMSTASRELSHEGTGVLSERTRLQLDPWRQHMATRLCSGASVEDVARDFAGVTSCTEEQALLYARDLFAALCASAA